MRINKTQITETPLWFFRIENNEFLKFKYVFRGFPYPKDAPPTCFTVDLPV